tara:strand:+ start:925 stop:2604 length:1680 start_codon:yes stop_codon:yes gene_type:complete
MTYNLLNFSGDGGREEDFINIIQFVQPDLIIAQEIEGNTGFTRFKSDVLEMVESGAWSGAPFINQSAQQDIALYFRNDHFSLVSTSVVYSAQSFGTRDVIEWVMVHNLSGVEFNVYGVHLKASSGDSNAQERLEETTILRDHLNDLAPNSYFIVGGDFNIYSNNYSSEPAFTMLTGSGSDNDGQLFDPIDRIGHWHNNSSYADVHTQSTRTSNFGGGATGGMDDRFDWLFVSQAILNDSSEMYYIQDTYCAFGNDGQHFNDAINDGNNSVVSNEIANSLHNASDHIPVYMDIWFDDLTYSDEGIIISEIMVNPSSVADSYGEWFEIINITESTIDINGWTIKDSGEDEHVIDSQGSSILVHPNDYFVLTRNGDISLNGGVESDYDYGGFSLSNSADEVILLDTTGAIVDEVHYNEEWPFASGVSMEIQDLAVDNSNSEYWFQSTLSYGNGDLGSPGSPFSGLVDIDEKIIGPTSFSVTSLYPNPFNPEINIQVNNKKDGYILLEIYDYAGRRISTRKEGYFASGTHDLRWNASGQSSGVYFFKISLDSDQIIKKALLIK